MVRGGRSRRGSMQLSIEAIIILVIAIVLLGLGVAFIKSFFSQGEEALLGKFTPLKEECDVTSGNPVIPKEFHVKKGDITQSNICVYNNQNADITNGVFEMLGCIGPGIDDPTEDLFRVQSLGQTIPRGESTGYKTSITVLDDENVQVGNTYICNMQVIGENDNKIGPVQATFQVD